MNGMIKNMTLRSSYDDLDLSVLAVFPKDSPKAVLQLAHGMCGCKERFLPVMKYMAENGVACVAGDHRGHGGSVKSMDDLGYMYKGGYRALVDDMRMITRWVREQYPDVPFYLLGHSMGSLAARVYVKWDDSGVDGLILCGSPSWNPMSFIGKMISGMLCGVGLPRMRMSLIQKLTSARYNRRFRSEGELAWTCSDSESRKFIKENPVCNFQFTANATYSLMSMMIETYGGNGKWMLSNPQMPVLFISGQDDPTIISEAKYHSAVHYMNERGYMNVTSVLYPDMRHEVLNEIGKDVVWDDILSFIKDR